MLRADYQELCCAAHPSESSESGAFLRHESMREGLGLSLSRTPEPP